MVGYSLYTIGDKLHRGCAVPWTDWAALGLDALSLALPFVPALGLVARLGKHADNLGDVARLASKLDPTSFKSFTADNFRENLRRLTGKSLDEIVGMEAHHVLPRALNDKFGEIGIKNIHDPVFGSWVNPKGHRNWSYTYNQPWKVFLEEKRSAEEILDFARKLAKEYKFDVRFSIP